MKIEKYGLLHKKTQTLLSFYISSNDGGDFCGDVQFVLVTKSSKNNPIWLVESFDDAEFVRNTSTEWYNAGYKTPSHEFDASELEAVEVVLDIN